MEELLSQVVETLNQIGMAGLLTVITYKVLSIIETVIILLMIGYGISKAGSWLVKILD